MCIAAGVDGLEHMVIADGHRELELLVHAGLTPIDALATATTLAAAKVGTDARLGTAEPAKEADLVVVTASPLADIRNTRQIELVIKEDNSLILLH